MKKLILFGIVFLFSISLVSAITVDDITKDLVFHLEMDTNCTLDSSVNANEPSATAGTITHHSGNMVANLDGYCNYDAGNTRLTYPFLQEYNESNLNHTWAFWFEYETGATISIVMGTEVGGDFYQLLAPVREADANKAWASVADGGAPDSVLSNSTYTTGSHYIVMTRNLTHMILYVDGSYVNSVATARDGLSTIDTLCIGGRCLNDYGFKGNITQVIFANVTWGEAKIAFMNNSGNGRKLLTPPIQDAPVINLLLPVNNSANNSLSTNFTHNVNASDSILTNCSLYLNTSGTFGINTTDFSPTNNSDNYFNNIPLTEGSWLWNVECSDNNSNSSFAANNFTLKIDTTNPIIIPEGDLLNNKTVVYNGTLTTSINFSDEREIYSINVTFGNGTIIFNQTNMGVTAYQLNISENIGTTVSNNLTSRVCDSSTLQLIKDIDNKVKDQGIKYVMKKKFWIFDDKWVHIYPKNYISYNTPTTLKKKDRYAFTFNKKASPNAAETFIVESSDYIDIAKLHTKGGHLVIQSIGDNGYWVDFVNEEATKYEIKRISDTKIEVTVYGLRNKSMTFHSIGELNCVEQTFHFGNLNPIEAFTSEVLIGDTSTFYLNVTEDPITVPSINATLYYNNTAYPAGNISNFSISATAPTSINENTTNIPFYWSVIINGNPYNLTSYNQNVSDFFIDNCSDSSTIALNYTFYDEDNNTIISADITGTYNYSLNNLNKSYDLSVNNVNSTQICIFPNYVNISTDYYAYYEETNYPQRRYYGSDVTLNNVTQDIPLYLLYASDGIYVRFRVVDPYSNPIESVRGIMQRTIGGTLRTVEQEYTDSSGLATFWVNPDQDYIFTFSKSGHGSETFSLRPTTSEIYTVTLGSAISERNESYATGILFYFSPTTDLQNDTEYTFSFNMNSTFWTVTGCTAYLKNGTTVLTSSSSSYTTSSCDISMAYNSTGLDKIRLEAHYNLNSSDDIIASRTYTIAYRYPGQFSLKNTLDDIKAFGEAGMNDFTRMMIAFIVIFVIVGGLAYKTEAKDPEILVGLLIILVWLFSYVGWLTLNYDPIPTAWLKQYIIGILMLLGGGAYILKKMTD